MAVSPNKRAPMHLRPATRRWWRSICRRYLLQDHHLAILTAAGVLLDKADEARALLAEQGVLVKDRFNMPKVNPAWNVLRDATAGFAATMRQLGLPVDDVPEQEKG